MPSPLRMQLRCLLRLAVQSTGHAPPPWCCLSPRRWWFQAQHVEYSAIWSNTWTWLCSRAPSIMASSEGRWHTPIRWSYQCPTLCDAVVPIRECKDRTWIIGVLLIHAELELSGVLKVHKFDRGGGCEFRRCV
jgi:hypothetical protein